MVLSKPKLFPLKSFTLQKLEKMKKEASAKAKTFWAWADKLGRWIVLLVGQGIWGFLGQTISTHFGTVSPSSMFSMNQSLFLQKTEPLNPHPKYLFGIEIWIWDAKN